MFFFMVTLENHFLPHFPKRKLSIETKITWMENLDKYYDFVFRDQSQKTLFKGICQSRIIVINCISFHF